MALRKGLQAGEPLLNQAQDCQAILVERSEGCQQWAEDRDRDQDQD